MNGVRRTAKNLIVGGVRGASLWTWVGFCWAMTLLLLRAGRPVMLLDLPLFRLLDGAEVERVASYRLYPPFLHDQVRFLFSSALYHAAFGALSGPIGATPGSVRPARMAGERRGQDSTAGWIAWNLFLFLFLLLLDRWPLIHKGFLIPPLLPSVLALKFLASLAVAVTVYLTARRRRLPLQRHPTRPKWFPARIAGPSGLFPAVALLLMLGLLSAAGRRAASSPLPGRRSSSPPSTEAGRVAEPGGSVILIVIDTLRADHLGCYGYGRPVSPNIDSLANDGIRFATCISQAPWTIPSIMSIMTSMYPSVNGVQDVRSRIDPMRTTLAEAMRASGYRTCGVVSHTFVDRRFGFADGFERYDDKGAVRETAETTTNLAISMIEELKGDRFFLFVHYFDPHFPYDPPPPYDRLYAGGSGSGSSITWKEMKRYAHVDTPLPPGELERLIGLYDGEIQYTDAMVGRLLTFLKSSGIYEKSTILLTADHGEEFKDHGSMGHTRTLYDELLHVPLVLKLPGSAVSGKVIPDVVRSIDIAPTLLRRAGLEPAPDFQGVDLSPFWTDADAHGSPPAYSETSRHALLRSVRTADARYVQIIRPSFYHLRPGGTPDHEFYALEEDPGEENDLAVSSAMDSLREDLFRWISACEDERRRLPRGGKTEEVTFDEETIEHLRSLGYVQ